MIYLLLLLIPVKTNVKVFFFYYSLISLDLTMVDLTLGHCNNHFANCGLKM